MKKNIIFALSVLPLMLLSACNDTSSSTSSSTSSMGTSSGDTSTSTGTSIGGSSSDGSSSNSTSSESIDLNAIMDWVKSVIPSTTSRNVYLPTTDSSNISTISYNSSNTAVFSNTGVVNRQDSDVNINLGITVSAQGDSISSSKTVTVEKVEDVSANTIENALNQSQGSDVIAEGIVTKIREDGYFMQDSTAGIFVYQGENCSVGDKVSVSATLGQYKNDVQFTDSSTTVLSSNNTLPTPAYIPNLSSSTLKDNMNMVISMSNVTVTKVSAYSMGNDYSLGISDGSNSTTIFAKKNITTEAQNAFASFIESINVGSKIDLTNMVVSAYSQTPQILYIDPTELQAGELSEEDKYNAVLASLNTILSLDGKQISRNLNLITTSVYDSTIVWSSSNTSVLLNDGTVIRPDEGEPSVDVTLSYTITVGTKEYPTDSIELEVLPMQEIGDLDPYYDSININASADTLYEELKDLVTNTAKYYGYGSSYNDVMEEGATMPGDSHPTLFYSGNNSGAGWNKEHVMPRSIGNSGSSNDMHNIRPTVSSINSTRSNHPFGEVTHSTSNIVGSSYYASGSTYSYYSSGKFEPRDEVKGDVARVIFYDELRHGITISAVGTIDLFLKWNEQDPVDEYEMSMNEAIYDVQENRNPFIDNSQWVNEFYA